MGKISREDKRVRSTDMWFSDEKVFTVATPTYLQNDRICSSAVRRALMPPTHLISECEHFSGTSAFFENYHVSDAHA